VAGDKAAGEALLGGLFVRRHVQIPVEQIDFADASLPRDVAEHLHSFAWLRDLAAAATRERGARLAEKLTALWLEAHAGTVSEPAWRADLWGRRILFWTAYAPYILSSRDPAYRAALLNTLARGARHAERSAGRAPPGLRRIAGSARPGSPARSRARSTTTAASTAARRPSSSPSSRRCRSCAPPISPRAATCPMRRRKRWRARSQPCSA
jgi:uncharacterized heparinase superfamily protein